MACELLTREFKTLSGEQKLFAVRQQPASKQLELYAEIMSSFGPVVFTFIEDRYNLGDLIGLMKSCEHKKCSELIKRVVCMSVCEGREVQSHNFDLIFDGELMLSYRVFAFVLEVNFLSFFKQGLELNEQRQLEEAERLASEEQKNSSPKT